MVLQGGDIVHRPVIENNVRRLNSFKCHSCLSQLVLYIYRIIVNQNSIQDCLH